MMPSLFPDGKFVGKETYAAMLAQQNMTIDQFEADLKRQVADHAGCAISRWKARS